MDTKGQFSSIIAIIIIVVTIVIVITAIYLWFKGLQTNIKTPSSEALAGAVYSFSKI